MDTQVQQALTDNKIKYVQLYVLLAGYESVSLEQRDLQLIYDYLSREEELKTDRRYNGHNWELNYASIQRQRERTIPALERHLEKWERLGKIKAIEKLKSRWPAGKKFAVVLSHDIDYLEANSSMLRWRRLTKPSNTPLKRKLMYAASWAYGLVNKKKRWADLKEWITLEDKYGFKSSLFFLSQPLPQPHYEDTFYLYDDLVDFGDKKMKIAQIMKEIDRAGWDVGLHGSVNTHDKLDILVKEKKQIEQLLGKPIHTIRQHHLFYSINKTPRIQNEAGFEADSTLGSNISTDYRAGTGLPFFMYDFDKDEMLNLLQIPLVIQDVAMFSSQQLDEDMVFERCVELLKETAERTGAITLLWHNSFEPDSPEFRVYARLLKVINELGGWGCSVKQLNDWWRERAAQALSISNSNFSSQLPKEIKF